MKVKVVGRRARSARPWRCGGFTQGFYPLCFITLRFTSRVSTPSAFICLCVCVCVCRHYTFESVTLCVCARNILTSNCEQKRTLHFSMTGNFFSMTINADDVETRLVNPRVRDKSKGVKKPCCWVKPQQRQGRASRSSHHFHFHRKFAYFLQHTITITVGRASRSLSAAEDAFQSFSALRHPKV